VKTAKNLTALRTALACLAGIAACAAAFGQVPPAPAAPKSGQQGALQDLTGYWVSVVTEDWRYRMVTAPKGDYASVPLNAAGKAEADKWTTEQDGSCKAYGAAGLMRMPTRLHITWQDENTLKIESDWGQQVRLLHFDAKAAAGAGTLQGVSAARWVPPEGTMGGMGFAPPERPKTGGYLKVTTASLAPGWLRRNGAPYGAGTRLTEYFKTFVDPAGRTWFDVTTKVEDPEFLAMPFITSSDFMREPDGSKWAPHPCKP
jgi:hypothetical protein